MSFLAAPSCTHRFLWSVQRYIFFFHPSVSFVKTVFLCQGYSSRYFSSFYKALPWWHLHHPSQFTNICTKLAFSLLIQSRAHHWKGYRVMLDSQLYAGTCLAFWRVPWRVCFVGCLLCSARCYRSSRDEWMLLPRYHSRLLGPCGAAGRPECDVPAQAPFLDPKIPLARICDDLEVKPEYSSVFFWGRMCITAKAWNSDLTHWEHAGVFFVFVFFDSLSSHCFLSHLSPKQSRLLDHSCSECSRLFHLVSRCVGISPSSLRCRSSRLQRTRKCSCKLFILIICSNGQGPL